MVADLLRSVPGLDVVRSGGLGSLTSVFMRGTNFNHVLVLMDGIEMNDPLSGAFDFSNLTTDHIERIEILRGPQGPLYGSNALGGVIQIFTKNPTETIYKALTVEAGSFNSYKANTRVMGGTESIQGTLELSFLDTEGISLS